MQELVKLEGITKRFGSLVANDSVDFSINEGEIHALIGENGAGKTTLMRILYGQYQPDEGNIFINGQKVSYDISTAIKFGIGMVHQNFMQIPSMSVLENIILGRGPQKEFLIDYKAEAKKIEAILAKLGLKLPLNTPIGNLSVGERQKIEIAKTLYLGAKVLILDEPTAVLTPQESDELFTILKELIKEQRSIVFISHKLREVITVGDRITVMRKGQVVNHFQRGEVDEVGIAEAMVGRQNVLTEKPTKREVYVDEVFQVKNLWFFNDEGLPKLKGVSFSVKAGEILGIGGVEGNGQTELARLMIGSLPPTAGQILLLGESLNEKSIRQRRELGMGYISDDRMVEGLALDGSVEENLICGEEDRQPFSRHSVMSPPQVLNHAKTLVERYDIRGVVFGKPVKSLSGGNLQKAILAREINREPKVLIASQIARGLDIGASNAVHELILEQKRKGTAVVLISADLDELLYMSDRIVVFSEGSITGEITNVLEVTEAEMGLLMGGIHRTAGEKTNAN